MSRTTRRQLSAVAFAAAVYGAIAAWIEIPGGDGNRYAPAFAALIVAIASIFFALCVRLLGAGISWRMLVLSVAGGFVVVWAYFAGDAVGCWSCYEEHGDFSNGGYAIFAIVFILIWTAGTSVAIAIGSAIVLFALRLRDDFIRRRAPPG